VHVLLGGLGASSFGSPTSRWTENARQIYLNAVAWALDAAQAEIFGTVSSGGEPIADAKVTAVEAGASARTDADGGYSLGVPDGTHTVRVDAVGYEPFETTVEVGVEERVRLDAELVPIPRGAIAGTVAGEDGAPLGDVGVTLSGPQEAEANTAADGTFGFSDLLPGDYVLTVGTTGYLTQEVPVTVLRGETATVAVTLHAHDIAILGDADGALVGFLRGHGIATEERAWSGIAADAGRYEAIVVNGGDPTAAEFDALVAAADGAGTSLVFTGTWGILNGGLRVLAEHRPAEVELGPQGYHDGAVELTGFAASHPLFAGLSAPLLPVVADGYYGAVESYVGPYLAGISAEARGPLGVSVAYDFRSADSVHVLLSTGAASDYIGPGYGWTAAGEQLFLNALAWARGVEQVAPSAPTLEIDDELVTGSPVTLTGTAEFRSTVTILRNGEPAAEAEPARDGSFSAEVVLAEGPNVFTATATNYAGSSPASEPVTVTLDTMGPSVEWTPADRTGYFDAHLVVSGTATDAGAGVAKVLVNGEEASLAGDGNFAAEVQLAEGPNEITVVARDRLGHETSETRRVAFFRYGAAWSVAADKGRKGTLTAFLDLTNAAGTPIRVDSAIAQLVRDDGGVEVSESMQFEDGRYKAKLGRPPAGTYSLRGLLVVSGWNVRLTGPTVIRVGETAGATSDSP
jgi:hypothetical protein